ncbi:MAG: helix-turn-helix domain-containing protein [Treponema sp.]|jgi:hypothetical protein|nr:helix-turn-helix domain-containing protein [Treponema sp.]
MKQEKNGNFAVIPFKVRNDKSICPDAQLLYGEIAALCGSEGRCRSDTGYFAKVFGEPEKTIQQWIASLRKGGHITESTAIHDVELKNSRGVHEYMLAASF